VVENLLVAQHMRLTVICRGAEYLSPGGKRALDRAFYWLEVDLVDCANRLAGEMSYGQQRRLEIAPCVPGQR
jgi:branched-chain amino acid transport system ATP-binding protein